MKYSIIDDEGYVINIIYSNEKYKNNKDNIKPYNGKSIGESYYKDKNLEIEFANLKKQNDILESCIIELSKKIYK